MKNLLTSAGIEPATFRIVAQHLNHCATAADPFWFRKITTYHYILADVNTRLFKMIVGVLTTCHTKYTSDSNICIFLFNRKTLQVFVTYLTGALYVHLLWFYKHQHDNGVRSAWQRWWFQWRFWFLPSVPGYLREDEGHKPDPWRNPIERNHTGLHLENEVYRVWQVVNTPTVILNNPAQTIRMINI